MKRRGALALLGAAMLPGCGKRADLAVGSKNFTESIVLAHMYAQLVEHRGLSVQRRLDLGGTQVAMEAIRRGDIDLYPEYTGTALVTVLKLPPSSDPAKTFETVRRFYEQNYQLVWLAPAPMNNTQALASTRKTAQRYGLRTLSDLSKAAPQLRLGAVPEFTQREDGLPGLQRVYGGFAFKSISLFDIGLKYKALESGNVDVVVAFGTDGQIAADGLVVFEDDKHAWPSYHVAPVVRADTLRSYPAIEPALNALAPLLTDAAMRDVNEQVDASKREPADVARAFLQSRALL